jgi:hypothetical protein
VFHEQVQEGSAGGDGPLGHNSPCVHAGSKAGVAAPTCMQQAHAYGCCMWDHAHTGMRTMLNARAAGGGRPAGAGAAAAVRAQAAGTMLCSMCIVCL